MYPMYPNTITIIVTILGVGFALFTLLSRRIDAMEGRLNSRIDAVTSRIDSVNTRLDALYQALFSHKDPAA